MTPMNDPEDRARGVWQSGPADAFAMPVEDLRRHADTFQRRIRNRNLREYLAGLLVAPFFLANILHFDSAWLKIGSALTLMGGVFILVNLHFRGGARAIYPSADCRTAYIGELTRQRDALRSVWLWYVLPLVPGGIIFRIGWHLTHPELKFWNFAGDAFVLLISIFVIGLNQWGANRLQRQIDEAEELLHPRSEEH